MRQIVAVVQTFLRGGNLAREDEEKEEEEETQQLTTAGDQEGHLRFWPRKSTHLLTL